MFLSRLLSSLSTAWRMKSAIFSFFSNTLSMRFRVSSANLTEVMVTFIGGLPIKISPLKAISLIDSTRNICDIGYTVNQRRRT